MSISNDNEMKSRLMKMNTIMDELYNPDGSHGGDEGNEDDFYGLNEDENPRKRRSESSKFGIVKKRRFCWDEGLHFRFLEFAFRYGIETITPQKLYDTMKGYMGDVSYDFFNDYLQMMRANMDEALQDFLLCYNQAEQFCRSYPSPDSASSRFNTYPFAPVLSNLKSSILARAQLELFSVDPAYMSSKPLELSRPAALEMEKLQGPQSVQSVKGPQSLQPSQGVQTMPPVQTIQPMQPVQPTQLSQPLQPSPVQLSQPLQPAQSLQSLQSLQSQPLQPSQSSQTRNGYLEPSELPLPFMMSEGGIDTMGQQVQLHQEVMQHNEEMWRRTCDEGSEKSGLDSLAALFPGYDPLAESAANSILTAPADYYLQSVDTVLKEPPRLETEDSLFGSEYNEGTSDLFDFLK